MSVTSDHPGLEAFNQARVRRLATNVEAVRWDSDAAQETVARICREAALQCQRVIAAYSCMDIADETGETNRIMG
jgi:hypothetical protein